ncbi:hypothetical protein V0242_09140 [Aeromonas hydrophila]|uniref:hypothetical protein n=1 Tax=Aeromonas hydrophila TaxID=644 RepID=UPI002ED05854|nr:hypothetical protein V0242_09140 [Aeromonas hydrophila]
MPTHLTVQASPLSQVQLGEWEGGAHPDVLAEQEGTAYFRLMMSSAESGQVYPVLGRIWFEDDRNHRLFLPQEKGAPSTALGQLVRWGIEFFPTALHALHDGSYTLQLPLRWPQSGMDTVLFNVALSGFEDTHRLEIMADSDKWDISMLFDSHALDASVDIPVKICLDPFSVSSAALSIQEETVMTNKVGDKLPYQLELLNDKNEQQIRYLDAVLKPEKIVQIPALVSSGPLSGIKNTCLEYLFRLSVPEKRAGITSGHYSQTLFLTLSQGL